MLRYCAAAIIPFTQSLVGYCYLEACFSLVIVLNLVVLCFESQFSFEKCPSGRGSYLIFPFETGLVLASSVYDP